MDTQAEEAQGEEVRTVEVHATFRHSAGRLGTYYLTVIRDEGRFVGWRSGNPPRVQVPPKDLGVPGEWVEVGPCATLEAYAPTAWVIPPGGRDDRAGSALALVRIDGADTAMLARLSWDESEALAPGSRLVARFADERVGAVTDFWFEPEGSGEHG